MRNRRWRYTLLGVWRDWLRDDGQTLIYVVKVLLACLLAMWISLRFELEQPRTALLTVMIVMQARTSMVLAKSYYRFWGTIVGILASLVLVGLFAQERILFLGYLAVWIGLCTAGSMVFRHHQSYAFVLAGYTICIVGLPATLNPGQTFDIAMTRFSEIMVGLASASLVSAIVFPQGVGDLLRNAVRKRYRDFSGLLRSLNREKLAGPATQAATLRMVGDVFELESFHASSGMESDYSRAYRQRLNLLNAEFMAATTSFHALEQLLRRLYMGGHPHVVDALLVLFSPIQSAVVLHQREIRNEQEARHAALTIKALRDRWPLHVNEVQSSLPESLTATEQLDFATGAELVQRVLEELHAYTNTYAGLNEPGARLPSTSIQTPRLGMHFDPLAALLAGIRGALVLTVMAGIWILFDWRSGIEAITIGMITSTLFASTPSPSKTVRHFIIGALIGTALLYICNFQLLPQAQGFLMLALAVTPAIALAAWLTTYPSVAVVGTGIFLIFLSHIGFNQVFSANPVTFLNDAMADLMAIMIAGLFYNLIDLTNSHWSRTRVARAMRELVQDACLQALPLQRAHLETQARELLLRMGAARRAADAKDKEVVDWLLSTLEIGHAVLVLRAQLATVDDTALRGRIEQSLSHIARLFGKPSSRLRHAAIQSITRSIDQLQASEAQAQLPQSSYRELLTMLHFIRGALLDSDSVLSLSAPLSQPPLTTQELSHA
ncbi:FUSC family protein [Methylobacillus arboreus]|uniref:FUSC family protein n=1 Tax=Methylobacillus arboreus TaxID=755170 RepID=UPI001E4A6F7D|nr:FUSC family protein [Methylobacillus arboreus]MCB5190794.1 FUSC family protein [Methylobacillus arboreus]